jgi:hypothetical protein
MEEIPVADGTVSHWIIQRPGAQERRRD